MPRLTADQWETVRAEREAGATFRELADRHGVSDAAIVKRSKAEGWGQRAKDERLELVVKKLKSAGMSESSILMDIECANKEHIAEIEHAKRNFVAYLKDAFIAASIAFNRGYVAHLRSLYAIFWLYDKKEKETERKEPSTDYQKRKRIRSAVSSLIHDALKKGARKKSFEALFGYPPSRLKRRLMSTMPKGYCWDDYLTGKLHIDHIVPVSVFNYSDKSHFDFIRAWSLKNLQFLPKRENLIKSNKLSEPFQPSLCF